MADPVSVLCGQCVCVGSSPVSQGFLIHGTSVAYMWNIDGHVEGRNPVHFYLCLQGLVGGTLYNRRAKNVC